MQGRGSYADLVNGANLLSSVPTMNWAVLLTLALQPDRNTCQDHSL